jgi:gamma-glutamylcyclotransferase (GGCT)/AIG2-like uncharacterized protein YtfP
VFVYGSLKNGKGNHSLLGNSKFLGRCYIEGPHRMLSLGGYPGLVEKEDIPNSKVVGEVYQISEETLRALDYLEGHPRYYCRYKVETPFKNAWAYYLPAAYLDKGYPDAGMCWHPSQDELQWMQGVENHA